MIKVLGIGDNVCDKYLHIHTIYPGGNALNVAVFAHMMGHEAAYLGVFGDDEVGKHVHDVASSLNIDLSHCRYEIGENGCARVQLVNGDRVFLPGNAAKRVARTKPPILTALDAEYIKGFDLIHTSIFSYMESEMPVIRKHGKFVSMDFSNSYTEAYLKKMAPYIDCAEISCGDDPVEKIKEQMNRIRAYGCKHIVLATRGAKGAIVNVDGTFYEQSPCLVKAKDTMGAGDSFIACFLVNYLDAIQEAVDFPKLVEMHGITSKAEYKDMLIRLCLYRASVFSSKQCQRDGSFGYGKQVDLTDDDLSVMKKL